MEVGTVLVKVGATLVKVTLDGLVLLGGVYVNELGFVAVVVLKLVTLLGVVTDGVDTLLTELKDTEDER